MPLLAVLRDCCPPYLALLLPVIGIPSILWGALMALAGLYEKRHGLQEGQQKSSRKLEIGIGLVVLGVAILAAFAAAIVFMI
jgi:predicted metal-binding membrane protein